MDFEPTYTKEQEQFREAADAYYQAGFEISLPDRLARFVFLTAGLRIVDVCRHSRAAVADVTRLYFQIGQQMAILPLVRRCDETYFSGRWESLALRVIRNSLLDSLWALIQRLVQRLGSGTGPEWIEAGIKLAHQEPLLAELRRDTRKLASEEVSIAALQVISSRLHIACVA